MAQQPQSSTRPADEPTAAWGPLPFIALGVAMIIVDATIVNVAIPSIQRDIGISITDAEWVSSIYSLVFASLLLTTGRLGDRFGRRTLYVWGTVLFVAASLVAAAAPSAGVLIFGRFLQGVGGAMILPNSLALLNSIYRGRQRNIALAVWGSTIGGMAALGPLLGGWLTENLSWRWAFLINLPIGIAVVAGLLRFAPNPKNPQAEKGIDLPGTLLSIAGFGALVFGLIEGQRYGWLRPSGPDLSVFGVTWPSESISPSAVAFLVAAVCLSLFVWVERARAQQGLVRLLDFGLFAIPSFTYGNIAALIVSLGEFGLLFALPLFLQSVLGYSAFGTGVILLALALGSFVASGMVAQVANRFGGRFAVRVGLLLEVVGIVGIGFVVSPTISGWALAPWLFLYGLGVGFATAQLTGVVLADVPVAESGQASAVQSTSRQVGAALGTAILGAVLVTSLGSQAIKELEAVGVPAAQAQQVAQAVKQEPARVIPTLEPQQQAAVGQAFSTAIEHVAWTAAAFILLGFLATMLLPPQTDQLSPAELAETRRGRRRGGG